MLRVVTKTPALQFITPVIVLISYSHTMGSFKTYTFQVDRAGNFFCLTLISNSY